MLDPHLFDLLSRTAPGPFTATGDLPEADGFATVVGPSRPSRREVLRLSATATVGGLIAAWPAGDVDAHPWLWAGARLLFATGVSWLVGRALDHLFPKDPDVLGVHRRPTPRPSACAFHNRYAEPHRVTNPRYHVPCSRSERCGCYVEVGDYVRCGAARRLPEFSDLNGAELECSRRHHGGVLIPVGLRSAPDGQASGFQAACRQHRLNPQDFDFEYVRPFQVTAAEPPRPTPVQSQVPVQQNSHPRQKTSVVPVTGYGVIRRTTGECCLLTLVA